MLLLMANILYVHNYYYYGEKASEETQDRCRRELYILKNNIAFSYKDFGGFFENVNCQCSFSSTNFTSKPAFPNQNNLVLKNSDIDSCVLYS